MGGCTDGWAKGWMDGQIDVYPFTQQGGWRDAWMFGLLFVQGMNGRMDGQMDE